MCSAKKKNGEVCRAFAGQGTDHFGIGRCKYHGGSTSAHKKNAVAIEAKRRMVTLGDAIELQPVDSLLLLHHAAAGHVAWARQQIAEMAREDLATREGEVLLKLYDEERDRLARVAEVCLKSGVRAEQLALQEDLAARMSGYLTAVLGELRLSPGQQRALRPALEKHSPLIDGHPVTDDSQDEKIADALADDYLPAEWVKSQPSPPRSRRA